MQRIHAALAIAILLATGWVLAVNVHYLADLLIDDSYITYVYARNLADGFGLRYNASDATATEGFSSLLQVLVVGLFEGRGLDPLAATRALGLALLVSIPIAGAYALRRTVDAPMGFLLLALAAAHFVLAFLPETRRHVASGMDTILFAAIHAWVFLWAARWAMAPGRVGPGTGSVGVVLLSMLVVARPEGIVLAAGYLAAMALLVFADASTRREEGSTRAFWIALGGTAAAVGAFLLWRLVSFGDVLPNPYYVKAHNAIYGSHASFLAGAAEVGRFLGTRLLPFAGLVTCVGLLSGGGSVWLRLAVLLLPSIFGVVSYANAIHEMAFGYRYAYPHLTPVVIALAWGIARLWATKPRAALGLVLLLVVGAVSIPSPARHFAAASTDRPLAVATDWLSFDPETSGDPHVDLALDLRDTGLSAAGRVLLGSAGMIPYFSRFTAIDWVGLNDNHLSGRLPLTLDEVAAYIDSKQPDVFVSIFPPASPRSDDRESDPAFGSAAVQAVLNPSVPSLFGQWNRAQVERLTYDQMSAIRDQYVYGTHYSLGRKLALIAYVRRDSPHAGRVLDVLRNSERSSRSMALGAAYRNDPSQHLEALPPDRARKPQGRAEPSR